MESSVTSGAASLGAAFLIGGEDIDRYFMTKDGAKIKHPKLRGEWAELCFMVRAAEKGLQVSKPWGETARYDFAVERDGHFVRVQVKSTMFRDRGGYSCTVRGCRGPYEGDMFDYVAAYLIPENLWYIIPEEMIRGQGSIAVYPRLKKSKYGRYREAWHLLGAGVIQACAESSAAAWAVPPGLDSFLRLSQR
jgi:hypothetical protein